MFENVDETPAQKKLHKQAPRELSTTYPVISNFSTPPDMTNSHARAPGHTLVTQSLPYSWSSTGDTFLGVVLVLCTVIGTPANATAIRSVLYNFLNVFSFELLIK
jgi:hypothetical protein